MQQLPVQPRIEQHLFRRTQVRQVLDARRQQDRARYLGELREVLLDERVRYHVKNVIALWLAKVPDPTPDEARMLMASDVEDGPLPRLVLDALQNSAAWFDVLEGMGWWASQLAKSNDNRCEQVLHLLAPLGRPMRRRSSESARGMVRRRY